MTEEFTLEKKAGKKREQRPLSGSASSFGGNVGRAETFKPAKRTFTP